MSAVSVSLAGGRRRVEYTFAFGLYNGDSTSRGWMQRHLGRFLELRPGTPGAGAKVGPGAEARVDLLRAECCHLAGEVLDPLQKCSDVGEGATLASSG
jgi:hypothetical protein